ncbi:hypothetical protein FOZ63_015414 [Perkinsus olseni]|uniref:Uncharacterized protein n=1 Tax=Perkinsus olseni TaxID=32597 RepID=A0A7J6SXQ5_PEROL|nr:hypothetical protein FOZ63_015414 [Perkinsus olseni]
MSSHESLVGDDATQSDYPTVGSLTGSDGAVPASFRGSLSRHSPHHHHRHHHHDRNSSIFVLPGGDSFYGIYDTPAAQIGRQLGENQVTCSLGGCIPLTGPSMGRPSEDC